MKFLEPVDRVFNKEPADHPGIVCIKIECGTPRGIVFGVEVVGRVIAEIISVWAKVVVDSVQHNCQSGLMRRINEMTEIIRCTIRMARSVEIHAIVTPVPFSWKICNLHSLHDGYSEPYQMFTMFDHD